MEKSVFCFHLTAYDPALLPQVSRALEKRTELLSREKVPGLWKLTDRLNRRAVPDDPAALAGGRRLGIVFLVLGLLLFLPSVLQPREMLGPLVGGAVAIVWGIWRIRASLGRSDRSFVSAAKKLLADRETITPEMQLCVLFAGDGMTLSAAGQDPVAVPYSALSLAVETPDLFLLVHDTRATLLQKRDLEGGNVDAFRTFLAEKAARYQSIA